MEESVEVEGNLYEAAGKKITCSHCDGQRFGHADSLSELAGIFNPHAKAQAGFLSMLSCKSCGRVELFNVKLKKLAEVLECCGCGEPIPANMDKCTKCGWTYKTGEG